MNVILERTDPEPGDTHRFGKLLANGFNCDTLEWPESGGEYQCLPTGTYDLTLGEHHPGMPDAYPCYHISSADVPIERGFEIHVGNKLRDSEGCILLGTSMGWLDGELAVLHSKLAHTNFMMAMQNMPTAQLVIMYGTSPNESQAL